MKRAFIIAVIILLLGVGCGRPPVNPTLSMTAVSTEEKFLFTTEPQDAVFNIAIGWTGGMGSMPVLDIKTGRPKALNGSSIYFDESYRDKVRAKLPSCIVGEPNIVVSANITLTSRRDVNSSIPDAPEETYYEAVVNKLNDISVAAEACE